MEKIYLWSCPIEVFEDDQAILIYNSREPDEEFHHDPENCYTIKKLEAKFNCTIKFLDDCSYAVLGLTDIDGFLSEVDYMEFYEMVKGNEF